MRLSERVKRAAVWGVGLDLANQFLQIVLSLVLVRLLTPEIYGQYGLLNSLLVFVYVFSMQSFMERILFARRDSEISYSSYWTLGVIMHGILFVLVNAIALGVRTIPTYAAIAPYLHLASFGFLLNVPRIYWTVILQRDLDWRRLRILKLISILLYSAVAITLAASGFGILALVMQTLIVPLPFVIDLLAKQRDRLRWEIDRAQLREIVRYGSLRSLSQIIVTGQNVVEAAAFIPIQGYDRYGIYGRALGIARLSSGFLPAQITAQLYPALARLSPRSAAARTSCALIVRLMIWISLPLALVCALVPETVVDILYGPKWNEVAPLVAISLVIVISAAIRNVMATLVLTNLGPRLVVVGDGMVFLAVAFGLLWILPYGVIAYARLLAAANFLGAAYLAIILVWHGALDGTELLRALIASLIGAAVAWAALAMLPLEYPMSISRIGTLALLSVLSAAMLFYAIRLLDADGMRGVLTYVPAGQWIRKLAMLRT